MTLVVCPFASLAEVMGRIRPDAVVTIASPGREPPRLDAPRHLHLAFNDIAGPADGLVPPAAADIAALLRFGQGDGAGTLAIACEMGVSRSTAAAFALACGREPDRPEAAIAAALRHGCPVATPNPLLVALADAALGRRGRMVAAVRAIGRGADYVPYSFATLPPAMPAQAGPIRRGPVRPGLVGPAIPWCEERVATPASSPSPARAGLPRPTA